VLQRKMDCVRRELLKDEVSEFILTIDSRGCVSRDLKEISIVDQEGSRGTIDLVERDKVPKQK
jgi:hypothetical protein